MNEDAAPAAADAEIRLQEVPDGHKAELRLWLRLLACATLAESEIRRRLRDRFGATLPRFDLLAQLDRAETGLTLGEVSRRMMVTNGNVTGLVDRLAGSGHIERFAASGDRRVQRIRLTPAGRADFRRMAAEHETWIAGFFGGLSEAETAQLTALLGRARSSLHRAVHDRKSPE